MNIIVKDKDNNILYQNKDSDKDASFVKIEFDIYDVIKVKTPTGSMLMNDVTEADIWNFE